jgi:hypothetical protein
MKGKILFYSEEKGSGIILTEDKKKHKFEVMEWQDFDNMPKTSMLVEFELNDNNEAVEIVGIQEEVQASQENTEEKNVVTQEEPNNQNVEDESKSEDKEQHVNKKDVQKELENKKKKKEFMSDEELLKLETIPLEKTIDEVLGEYFHKAIKAIKDENVDKKSKLLNYGLMKRFLNTAYNHLVDKDPSFVDGNLMNLKLTLEDLHKIHHDMADKKQFPELKFENVFLRSQKVYAKIEVEYEKNKNQFITYNNSAGLLSKKIKTAEENLRKLSIKSKEYSDLNLNTKRLRTKYVRMLDVLSAIEKANKKFKVLMEDFQAAYKLDFINKFKQVGESTFDILTISLNSKAHKFDQYMWEQAKKSSGIKKFFLEAQIDGGFSSKTFLKYFLSSLDKSKLNQEHKEMYKMLEYLESLEKRQILIIDDKFDILPSLTYFANHIERDFKVTTSIPSDAIRQAFSQKIEFMIVNINIKKMKLFEFIKSVNDLNRGIEFILISDSFTKDLVVKSKKLNVHNFVATNVSDEMLAKSLRKVIIGEEADI